MPYAILRFAKKKMGAVNQAGSHNERKKEAYKSNPDINLKRTDLNYHLIKPTNTYRKMVEHRLLKNNCKVRKNSTVLVETLITASPEFINSLPAEEQKEYFVRALSFMEEQVGKENIISAVVHMDEKTPHMHLSFVPITKDKRLSAKDILGNQIKLSEWQTKFHEFMNQRWNELERGVSSMITKRKHIPAWLFKQAERLDKSYSEVVNALADINAFNVGRKRDIALKTLAKWIPEAEKFTVQIKNINKYIKQLEETLRTETALNTDYRSKVFVGEEALKEANFEIYELRRKLEQTKKLLGRIPPEILEKYSNNPKPREWRGR